MMPTCRKKFQGTLPDHSANVLGGLIEGKWFLNPQQAYFIKASYDKGNGPPNIFRCRIPA